MDSPSRRPRFDALENVTHPGSTLLNFELPHKVDDPAALLYLSSLSLRS